MKTLCNILSVSILPMLMLAMQHCKNDPAPPPLTELEKLPPATQSGKRTFGCLVDGKAWVNQNAGTVGGFYQTGTLSVSCGLSDDFFEGIISIDVYDLDLKEQSYILTESIAYGKNARYYDYNTHCEFFTSNTYKGILNITHLDKVNFIISGTFQFDVYSLACNRIIKVTDGRFEIEYAA